MELKSPPINRCPGAAQMNERSASASKCNGRPSVSPYIRFMISGEPVRMDWNSTSRRTCASSKTLRGRGMLWT